MSGKKGKKLGPPLKGIRVLDFTRFQQGPSATVLLADMGAEVIKIEQRLVGDDGRRVYPDPDGFCAYFETLNRNKKSLTVDLRHPEGKQIVYRLVKTTDVVAENFRRGVMERLGLGYDTLSKINPRLIFASASAFGPKGPRRTMGGADIVAQAMGGLMMANKEGDEPRLVAPAVADQVGGIVFAYGIVLALLAREKYGVGQAVDVSLVGSQVALQPASITRYLRSGQPALGSPRDRARPAFNIYETADKGKWIAIGMPGDERAWPSLCEALGVPEMGKDPRFAGREDRIRQAKELMAAIQHIFRTKTQREWLSILEKHDVPSGPVYDYAELAEDAQVKANDYIVSLHHPVHGEFRAPGQVVQLSQTPGKIHSLAPALGQHTEEILRQAGYSPEEIARLRQEEVI